MGFKDYRSLEEIAGTWATDPQAPGDRDSLYRLLVEAICDGAFFDDGLAVRAHALLRAMDPEGEGYAPFPYQAELLPDGSVRAVTGRRVPDFETPYDHVGLHAYLGRAEGVPASAAEDPEAFFDWVRDTEALSHGEAVDRLFAHVVIGKRAFRNWCLVSRRAVPGFVSDWLDHGPLDPNHRGALPLPGTDLISLCEAVTWLTTGQARTAPILKRLMHRHHGRRWPRGLWRELEEDADKLVAALRNDSLTAYGQLDDGPHVAIRPEFFMSDVFAEFPNDTIGPDPLAFERGSYPDKLPTYRSVRFRSADLSNALRREVRAPATRSVGRRSTMAGRRRCLNWLVQLMRAGPQEAPRRVYMEEAKRRFAVMDRQFVQVWAQARQEVDSPEWGRAGPKPKSSIQFPE